MRQIGLYPALYISEHCETMHSPDTKRKPAFQPKHPVSLYIALFPSLSTSYIYSKVYLEIIGNWFFKDTGDCLWLF